MRPPPPHVSSTHPLGGQVEGSCHVYIYTLCKVYIIAYIHYTHTCAHSPPPPVPSARPPWGEGQVEGSFHMYSVIYTPIHAHPTQVNLSCVPMTQYFFVSTVGVILNQTPKIQNDQALGGYKDFYKVFSIHPEI